LRRSGAAVRLTLKEAGNHRHLLAHSIGWNHTREVGEIRFLVRKRDDEVLADLSTDERQQAAVAQQTEQKSANVLSPHTTFDSV
jgi:hypothetical protein